MNLSRIWSWFRGNSISSRASFQQARLDVEILEDRLAPSTTATSAYQLWRQQTFTINDQTVQAEPSTPSVQSVPQNASFGSLIGLSTAFADYPYRGDGYSVAVLDTGIDYTNPNLGDGFGPGYRVVAGWNFVNNTANATDDNGHGTAVAGIIASSNATYSGVAPDVNLISLKVLDSTGSGTFGAVQDALDWVVANRTKYNIIAVNMSLGSGNYTVNPYTYLDSDLSSLVNSGVFISVAAGNSFYNDNSQQGLDFPAIDPYVVSVGAVYDGNFGPVAWANGARDYTTAADLIASFSQRSSALSILAPGAMITTTYLNDTFESMAGTSMAAPVITGAAVLIHQALVAKGLTANEASILSFMKMTGVTVVDNDSANDNVVNTGLSFKRIDLAAALEAIGTPTVTLSPPVLQPISNQTVAPGGSLTLSLNGSDPNGLPLTYSASLLTSPSSQAYQLKVQLGLEYAGSYYTNEWGSNEKWLKSTSGTWYCILPTGALYRWTGSMATTLQPANLIASLAPSFYADPSLLWNAQPTLTPTLSVTGNQLTIHPPAGTTGSFQIQVTTTDGTLSASQTFTVTVQTTSSPQIASIATQSMLTNRVQTLTLSMTIAQASSLTYSAILVGTYAALPATLVIKGNQLTLYSSPNFTGSFSVKVTASNSSLSTSTTFQVNVAAAAVADVFKADFNGDGIQDTAFFCQDGSWWVSLANANGSFVNENWGQWVAASNWKLIQIGHFNKDGKMDVVGFKNDGSWWVGTSTGTAFTTSLWAQWSAANNWSTVQVGDFNGDGLTDVIGFSTAGSWWVGISKGTAFTSTLWTQWSAASGWSSVQLLDINDDGKLDIVGFNKALNKWYVGYSTGNSFLVQAWTGSTPP